MYCICQNKRNTNIKCIKRIVKMKLNQIVFVNCIKHNRCRHYLEMLTSKPLLT